MFMSALVLFTNFRCRLWCSRTTGRIWNTSNIIDIHPVYQGRLLVQKSLSLLKLIKNVLIGTIKDYFLKLYTIIHTSMTSCSFVLHGTKRMSDSFGYWLLSSSNTFSRPKADSSITIAILTSIYVIYSELNANLNTRDSRAKFKDKMSNKINGNQRENSDEAHSLSTK